MQEHTSNQTDFGTFFYPRGFLISAFYEAIDAKNVQHDLLMSGYKIEDCLLYSSQEMAKKSQLDLEHNSSFIQQIGWSYDAVKIHLAAAQQGATFLFIYAPEDIQVEQVMTIIRKVPFKFVHRYHLITIEELR